MRDMHDETVESKPAPKKSTPPPDRWYKRYPLDYQRGTRRLSIAARGAYSDILDLLYMERGPIPDDNRWIASSLHITGRQWLKLREELFAAGKLILRDGCISNGRAETELSERAAATKTRPDRDRKSARKEPKVGQPNGTLSNEINGGKTTEAEAEAEGESKREDKGLIAVAARPSADAAADRQDAKVLLAKLLEAGGDALDQSSIGFVEVSTPRWWLERGCDLDRDVLPAIRSVCARQRGKRIAGWGYFTKAVVEAKATREQLLDMPLPVVEPRRLSAKAAANAMMEEIFNERSAA